MFKVLFIILLFMFLWPLVRLGYYLFTANRYVRRQQENFRQAYRQAYGEPENRRAGTDRRRRGPKKKVFSSSEGEYVEFEEIECDISERKTSEGQSGDNFMREEQVSDAEWTEIR